MDMKNKSKSKRRNTPGRIIYSQQEIERLEREEKEKRFWRNLMYDGLGGKKGHDN